MNKIIIENLWVADRMWINQRRRMCAQFPHLPVIFDNYANDTTKHVCKRAIKSNSNKKRKTAWITPKKGIWYVFKRWLSAGFRRRGFFQLYGKPEMYPLVISVILSRVYCADRMIGYSMIPDRPGEATVELIFPTGKLMFLSSSNGCPKMSIMKRNGQGGSFVSVDGESFTSDFYKKKGFFLVFCCSI
jgi:hypothetical protein